MNSLFRSAPITVFSIYKQLFLGLWALFFCIAIGIPSRAQLVPDSYGNNPTNVQWQQVETEHFKIIFAEREFAAVLYIAELSEHIYKEYQNRLGVTPKRKIALFYNGPNGLVSGKRARDTDDEFSIWRGNIFEKSPVPRLLGLERQLRTEIASEFRHRIESFPIDYWFYIFSRPTQSPWSDGITSYLAEPQQTPRDVSLMRNYWYDRSYNLTEPALQHRRNALTGRSQIQFFNQFFTGDSLQEMYTHRSNLLGMIPYFDFNTAFSSSYGLSYDQFQSQWEAYQFNQYRKQRPGPNSTGTRILPPTDILEYHGVAVNKKHDVVATISTPDNGSVLPELHVKSLTPGAPKTRIERGFFDASIDWSTDANLLAFSKRSYNNSSGQYMHQLRIWNRETGKISVVAGDKNGLFPAFSPDGSALVFAERTSASTLIWRNNLRTSELQKVYSVPQPLTVSHLAYHPENERIAVSFQQNGVFKAGLLNAETSQFTTVLTQPAVAVNARWSPSGEAIFFNREAKGVPNIFRAEVSGNSIKNTKQVTADFYGAELMGFLPHNPDSLQLLAKTDHDKINLFSARGHGSASMVPNKITADSSTADTIYNQNLKQRYSAETYNAFADISLGKPFAIPYYLNPDEFGLAVYVSALDPMQTHEFDYRGSIALGNPFQSFFYSSYTNNSFRPRLELTYNHFPSESAFFGKSREVRTSDIVGLSSLWKLTGLSQNYSDWYLGLTVRHLAFDYFSEESFRHHHPDLYFSNRKTRQTDLKTTLVWRNLEPSRHTLIHPLDGTGVRFSATASAGILGSQTQHARLNLDAYHIFPTLGDHRLYAYVNGITDLGEPAGRDYISLADDGNFQLPDEDFLGSINPGSDRFVRGYNTTVLGDNLLFGRLEYRIPFQFDTNKQLLGLIPPARTVFTVFADGGVMGRARTGPDTYKIESRYSLGAEVKRVFSFGGSFEITYKVGLGQPLDQSFGPHPYINIRSALPF